MKDYTSATYVYTSMPLSVTFSQRKHSPTEHVTLIQHFNIHTWIIVQIKVELVHHKCLLGVKLMI